MKYGSEENSYQRNLIIRLNTVFVESSVCMDDDIIIKVIAILTSQEGIRTNYSVQS